MADLSVLMPIVTGVGIFFVILMGFAALFKAFYVKVEQGTALIVNDMSATPRYILPVLWFIPLSIKKN